MILVAQEEIDLNHLKQNTETVRKSSGSLLMSGRNGSASDADCRISEDCSVPDVELMELGPLLEEGGGRQAASKVIHPEVGLFQIIPRETHFCGSIASVLSCYLSFCFFCEGSCNAC